MLSRSIFLCLLFQFYSSITNAEIYRWTDETGRIQFSDKKPLKSQSDNVSQKYNTKDPFTINISGRGYHIPLKTKGVIRSSVIKMSEILSDKLGIEYKNNTHIDVIIFGDKNSYIAYGGKPNTSGFYSRKKNEAVARKTYNDNTTLKTVIHETSHLLLSYNYRNIPRWLDEGLAEYFEGMKLSFTSVEIPPNERWHKRLKKLLLNGNLISLKEYISLTPGNWVAFDNANDNIGYAYGWSIMSFLMSTPEGQHTLSQLFSGLKNAKQNKDYSFNTINRFYPGGFNVFESDWKAWLYPKKSSTFY